MTPKEKAKQLYDKMEFETKYNSQPSTVHGMCKKLALVCVDEIELYRKQIQDEYDEDLYHAYGVEEYWQEVRKEISLL